MSSSPLVPFRPSSRASVCSPRLARRSWSVHFGLLLTGVLSTLLMGWAAEIWGTSNGYWAYHAEGYDHRVPPWVPPAWGLAYVILYRCEQRLVASGTWFDSLGKKLLVAGLVSLTLPVLGEIIAINLGVWTYAWPYQLWGVPILAIGLLLLLHGAVFVALFTVAHQRRLSDPLFGHSVMES